MTVPADLVPLARVLILHAASRKMASILTALWHRKTATADVPISTWPEPPIYQGQEPERVSDDPPSSLEIEEGGGIVQISDDRAWLRFKRGLECYAGDGFTQHSVAFVIPVHEPSAAWPTDDTAADTGLPRGYLERLRWIGDEALAMFRAWFFVEAAAGRLEIWGAPGSELAGLKRIEPHALGTGSQRAIIDFAASTLTTAVSREAVYALHVRWADQAQTKAPPAKAKDAGKSNVEILVERMLGSPDRVYTNDELKKWLRSEGRVLTNWKVEKDQARKDLGKVNPDLEAKYGKHDPR